jgi:hypothetical protein
LIESTFLVVAVIVVDGTVEYVGAPNRGNACGTIGVGVPIANVT